MYIYIDYAIIIADLQLTVDQLKEYALVEIEKHLYRNGRSLKDYSSMPFPMTVQENDVCNRLILEELAYNKVELAAEYTSLISSLTDEQKHVYQTIMDAVLSGVGGIFFVYGYGGTGKTFLWRTLSTFLRSNGHIVLNVTSSGIASLLLPGGRTAHSHFSIPLDINESSTCNITQGSNMVELLAIAKLIIWDEAPMVNKHCFEALDRTLRDVLRFSNPNSLEQPFGGKVIVFGGDFRQILPVIPKGSRQDIVHATINSSYLWNDCKVLLLTKNMRLQTGSIDANIETIRHF